MSVRIAIFYGKIFDGGLLALGGNIFNFGFFPLTETSLNN